MIQERLKSLRDEMRKRNIDYYIVPTADFHESEYVGEYFKARKWITGFTGSAGTAVIGMDEAGLWTDGRYFIQAENQLKGSGVTLFKMAQEGVPTINEYLEKNLKNGGVIGFDGRVVNTRLAEAFKEIADKKSGTLYTSEDLIDIIWNDRPSLPTSKAWILEEKYSGESVTSKLERIRKEMKECGADTHIMTCLFDIEWTFNLRGGDIEHVPVNLCFALIDEKNASYYINEADLDDKVKTYLKNNGVTLRPYEAIYDDAKNIPASAKVLLNKAQVNSRITDLLPKTATIIDKANPAELMKSCKNEVELQNLIKAHMKDAVAMTKFMYWLKTNVGRIEMTEVTAQDYLANLRAEQEGFIDLSFGTISAYGPNAAMMHYSATPDNCAALEPRGMLLVDSGGHYYEGSTDITRTFALGPVTDIEKKHFTAVLRANMNLSHARFLYGCSGLNLDILARGPIWDMDLDYQCGTGHGVGYLLNIHEGPNGFRWKIVPERKDSGVLEEGMCTTDEPGIYLEGQYGIRLENELICRKGAKNEYGQFMYFEDMTFVPFDLDLVDEKYLNAIDKERLNEYHKKVYETISPYLTDDEKNWLKTYTRQI
ncbi:MAG: aminopeptidase P family protein [Lachnospiraceae bacterium]|nr:aminopeptidase P family protein [Lachnospiraceae bacterium]